MPSQLLKKHTLLQMIDPYLPDNPVIVEAGAFGGQDTKKLSCHWPQARMHAFEPVPDIYALLKQNTSMLKNVTCHPYALSNKIGHAPFYLSEKPARAGRPFQAGSLHKPYQRLIFSDVLYKKVIDVFCTTLDEWAEKEKIEVVDLLWLDMQGHELYALKGATSLLSTVRVIYTEVNIPDAYENQPTYQEVVSWLSGYGFKEVGRDFDDAKEWLFGNVLFVRK